AASQPHRQLASGLPFPVGFKNSIHGELETALSGILTARMPHAHCSIDSSGHIAAAQTTGNPLAHLVLRGSLTGPNSDRTSIQKALRELREHHLEERLVIDCAHGNSGKDPHQQQVVFFDVATQIQEGNKAIAALMLESHLATGKQPFPDELETLRYGVSITDPCLGWAETEELVLAAEERLSTTMSSVQK
ncbi:MAG TPA: 3-deoxy-7-phosphoheptulonate synthase, partial [Chlamydiales bacterium]